MENVMVTQELGNGIKAHLDKVLTKMSQFEEVAGSGFGVMSPPQLTRFENNVLELFLDGNKSREIAKLSSVTTSHVSRTLKRIELKLGKDRRKWAAYSIFHV